MLTERRLWRTKPRAGATVAKGTNDVHESRKRKAHRPATSVVSGFPALAAHDLLREIAPILAERGIDVDESAPTSQRPVSRAAPRHNENIVLLRGSAREQAAAVLRSMVDAVANADTTLAADDLAGLAAYSLDDRTPSTYSCIAIALALLDQWLDSADLPTRAVIPATLTLCAQATTDIVALAGRGRALRSRDSLISRHGSRGVLWACALALEATIRELSHISSAAIDTSARTMIN
ncbi:hypothetical protein [Antrihabitans stalactiti]|uniref:Uncharacterized protein n=1 Tax=Antrihabitans stalactiti TaxID=2584121 RepID=A0A848KLC9_9NOCA|nr:hypothetical protein [Antrihabitans stalactiti]NMN98636.1 hypothetical protein [Antrihabitans stalactiti]